MPVVLTVQRFSRMMLVPVTAAKNLCYHCCVAGWVPSTHSTHSVLTLTVALEVGVINYPQLSAGKPSG